MGAERTNEKATVGQGRLRSGGRRLAGFPIAAASLVSIRALKGMGVQSEAGVVCEEGVERARCLKDAA